MARQSAPSSIVGYTRVSTEEKAREGSGRCACVELYAAWEGKSQTNFGATVTMSNTIW